MKLTLVEIAKRLGRGYYKTTKQLGADLKTINIYIPKVKSKDTVWSLNDDNSWYEVVTKVVQKGDLSRVNYLKLRNLERKLLA